MKSGGTLQFIWGSYLIVSSREISYKLSGSENPFRANKNKEGFEWTGALPEGPFPQQ